ncbi:MAG TPA: flagellar basal-body rod protein FlgG [Candidatus Latescibacteria bacterium]|nr:flagellar basal-body rod protein FlgG [Candidatus Latescibacterota bacterium]
MDRAMEIAATGMYAQQLYVDVLANNLANVNTTGFKEGSIHFQDLIYEQVRPQGAVSVGEAQAPVGIEIGYGTKPVATMRRFSQGELVPTENPLDLAIEGDGFFQVLRPDGRVYYTRDGSFRLSPEGQIVTSDGFALEPPIHIPLDAEEISIGRDGVVYVRLAGEAEPEEVGQIELARFVNPGGLRSVGGNLYQETIASGEPIVGPPASEGFGEVHQGYLERSNVDVVGAMVKIIVAQRAYEINSKVIRTSDEMLSTANNIKR